MMTLREKLQEAQERNGALEAEVRRLLEYIAACRLKFGDAAVNQAIYEYVPRVIEKQEFISAEEFLKRASEYRKQ